MEVSAWAVMKEKSELEPWTYEIEQIDENECLIEIDHCGVCYSDIHLIDNDWKWSKYPLVPGHEIIGTVKELGSGSSNLKVGDRVGVSWQRSSCLQCSDCLLGNENLCSVGYQGTAIAHHGGFASHFLADSRFTFKIPEGLDSKSSTTLLCAGATVFSGLRNAGMSSGQEIGILGLGGLGYLAVQFASRLGNKVTVFERSEDKAEYANKFGATQVFITKDTVPRKLNKPLDILLNTVDKPINWNQYLGLLASDGTLCFLGGIGNNIELNLGHLISKRRRIMGSPTAGRSMIIETLRIAAQYGIEPMIEEYSLKDVNLAIQNTRENKVKYKGVLNIN